MRSGRALAFTILLSAASCSSVNFQHTLERAPPVGPAVTPQPFPSPPSAPGPQGQADANTVRLPAEVQLSDIHVNGHDLVINMPDGTQMVIPNGAVFVPQIIIGNVKVPGTEVSALIIATGPTVATRLFVPARFTDFKRYGAVAMLAFSQVPGNNAELNRYRRICEAYVTTLPDAIVTNEDAPDLRQMVTIWPRSDMTKLREVYLTAPVRVAEECIPAVRYYDYGTATAWLAHVPRRAGLNRTGRGPFLVAWAPPSAMGKAQSAVLVLDLSDFDRTDEIERAFRIWKEDIEEDPPLWDKGWNIEFWKARIAAKLDKYGKQITDAFVMVPWMK